MWLRRPRFPRSLRPISFALTQRFGLVGARPETLLWRCNPSLKEAVPISRISKTANAALRVARERRLLRIGRMD